MGGEGEGPRGISGWWGRCAVLEKVVTVVGFIDIVTSEQRPEKGKEGTEGFSREGGSGGRGKAVLLERGPRHMASVLQEGACRGTGRGGRKHRGAIVPV